MDDVITETTSSISIQWCVFCTYIVPMLEMSPFKSVSITLVYTTFNYAPRTRHAAASPWCLLPLPVLAHAFACVAIGVWLQKWPERHPPGTRSPRQRRTDGLYWRQHGRQAGSALKGDYLIVGTCQEMGRAKPYINCTLWLQLLLLLYSISKGSPVVDQSVLSPWPMHGYVHEQTLFSFK